MVSNGPYVLTAWEHDQSMTLERNENYYGEKPTITRADYTLFDDPMAQALVAFENRRARPGAGHRNRPGAGQERSRTSGR